MMGYKSAFWNEIISSWRTMVCIISECHIMGNQMKN